MRTARVGIPVNQGEEAESMVITSDFEENGINGVESSEDSCDNDQDWTPAVATTPTSLRKPTPKRPDWTLTRPLSVNAPVQHPGPPPPRL